MKESRIVIVTEWVLRGISMLAIAGSLYLLIQKQYLVYSIGTISSVTLGSAGVLFILSEYCFSKYGGMNKLDAIIFGILFPAGFLATYEVIYHFSFLPLPTTSVLSQIGADLRYLATEGVVILPLFFLRRNIVFRRISGALLLIFGAMWFVWLLYGFPQYYLGVVYKHPILTTNDYWDTSLFYNFGSKTVLATFFASILKIPYWKEVENLIIRRKKPSRALTHSSD